jgi:formate dehydrogenase iron-sulfur subunit
MPKAFFIDTSRCTVACKQWHGLPAVATKQRGGHQNPPDLNPFNFKLVRFREEKLDGKVHWFFFPDQCRHCVDPACKGAADSYAPEAIVVDEKTRAVLYTDETRKLTADQCKEIREACPYDVPRRNEQTGLLTKCDMCIDRLRANLTPACVKTCCTGTMNFGERKEMLALAEGRLEGVKKTHPAALLIDAKDVGAIFLVTHPKNAQRRADRATPAKPLRCAEGESPGIVEAPEGAPGLAEPLSRRDLLAKLVSPLRRVAG